jgi:hypothetical protein
VNEEKLQEFLVAVERWQSDTASDNDSLLIQNVLQTGGVNLGQGNQVSITAPVIGTIDIQFQTAEQAQAFLPQLKQYTSPKPPPPDELPEA